MQPPPEADSDFPADLAEQVDSALESLWVGETGAFARLVEDESLSGEDVGKVLKGLAGADAEQPSSADLTNEAEARGYRIIRELGRGGMGVVYEAMQEGTKRVVAVKVMLAGPFASDAARRRFEREVELAARLRHPGIVRILESGLLSSGQRYFAMDYVEGVTLDRYLDVAKPDARRILQMIAELCDAVDHAHAQGVIHRDLKPSNVLIDEQGSPHILDFGLAKASDHAETDALAAAVSSPGQVLGTLRYLSPEQATGEPEAIDTRTDVYTLGVILFEALTGAAPFDTGGRPSEFIRRITESQPVSPCSLSREVDSEVETIILKALQKDKSHRYQSAREFGEDIRRYLAGEPIIARRPSNLYVLRKKLAKHRKSYGFAAALVVFLIASSIGWIWLQRHELAAARREALLIQSHLEAGRVEQYLGQAESLYDQNPDLPEVRLVFAQARMHMAELRGDDLWKEQAVGLLRRYLNSDPPQWSCGSLLDEIDPGTSTHSASECLTHAKADARDEAEMWYEWSYATMSPDQAISRAQAAVSSDGGHLLAWQRLARLCLQTGDTEGALRAARRLVDLGCDPFDWRMFQGDVFMRHGKYEDAVACYTAVADRYPDHNRPYRARALAHLCRREYALAIADYSQTVMMSGSRSDWEVYRRATPLWIVGRTEEAAADYREFCAAKSYATFGDVRLVLVLRDRARDCRASGRDAEALAALDEAKAVLNDVANRAPQGSWLAKIIACTAGELTPEALVNAASPVDREQICEAYYYAGEACLNAGEIERACRWFRDCVDTNLLLDLDSTTLDPMNEYHLALWRLESLCDVAAGPDNSPNE